MSEQRHRHKIILDEDRMPTRWYNVVPDLPSPPPASAAPRNAPAGRPG